LAGYVEILEDTLVAFRLPAYDPKLRVRERKHPKLYWVDPGLARSAAGRFRELDPRERGALFEGWIATVLSSYRDYQGAFDEMYYWAPARARDTEVDFLLLRDGKSVAIEAKASARIHDRHLSGLRAVAPLPGLQRRVLTYTGSRRMRTPDGIDIWPLPDLLEALQSDHLW
jgi:predicted AAA+ superfamily ATPase